MLHRLNRFFPLKLSIFCMTFLGTAAYAVDNFYELKLKTIDGKDFPSTELKGKVVIAVNTASKCGFTPQLKELQELYSKYKDQGFLVLAFPSNDFKQEPADASGVASFAKDQYGVNFPIMEKGPVTGKEKQPAFEYLTTQKSGVLFREVSWNFEKFLIGRDGKVLDRWNSMTNPSSTAVVSAVEKALASPKPSK